MKVLLLATIVEKKGSEGVSYKAIIRLSGRPLRVRTFKTKTQAKLWAQAEETRMREGEVRDVGKEARLHTVAELIDAAVEEFLRYDSSVQLTYHVAMEDVEIDGMKMRKKKRGNE